MKIETKETHVCVVGAGVCGLVSVKACLEAGLTVTCFDKSPTYGGLWCYRDDRRQTDNGGEFIPSVMKTTILNTSKELSSFSDFPPSAELPNFMKHDLYMDYIKSYVEHFKLMPHLKLRHEIVNFEPEFDRQTGKLSWLVEVRDLNDENNRTFKGKFDKLMVAVGHHNIPYSPTFPDQHKFKGEIIHASRIKDILSDDRLIDKRVVVIGFGNSACDAANDLAMVASKCYVSSHRGNWFIGRLSPSTGVYDFEDKKRWNYYRSKFLPRSVLDRIIVKRIKSRLDHNLLGLTPKHMPSEQVPAINDLFPYRVFTGGIILKRSVSHFTSEGVVFEGEEETECKADIVIMATGYQARLPFVNETELGLRLATNPNEYQLYLNMFAPNLRVAGLDFAGDDEAKQMEAIKSLAFIGLVQPAGSITVISELQSRLAALVFSDRCKLPNVKEMLKHYETTRSKRSKAIRSHSKDQLVGNWIGYCDEIARIIGVKPNMLQLLFKDFALWKLLMFGPSVSYQYRLQGPGRWCKARETIVTTQNRVYQGINEGKNHVLIELGRRSLKEKCENNNNNQQRHK